MNTSKKLIIAVVALAAVTGAALLGPKIYRDLVVGPAAAQPSLSTDGGMLDEGGSLVPSELEGEWSVDDGSLAGYRVDEVLNGTDVTVTGRTDRVEGTITIGAPEDEDALLTLEAATFTVDVASIETDNPSRDSYFSERAIDTSQHPTATFTLTEPISFDTIPDSGVVEQATVAGELDIAGVVQPVAVDVAVRSDGEVTEIAGSIPITFADFGVHAPNFAFVKVEPQGFVEFQLVATRR